MKDYRIPKSKFVTLQTRFIPSLGSWLLLGAVEFSMEGSWITESYVLPPEGSGRGTSERTSYDASLTPPDWLPTPEMELTRAVLRAGTAFSNEVFASDRDLWRDTPMKDGLTVVELRELALAHLRGEFTTALTEIASRTRCRALTLFLSDILGLKQFSIDTIGDA